MAKRKGRQTLLGARLADLQGVPRARSASTAGDNGPGANGYSRRKVRTSVPCDFEQGTVPASRGDECGSWVELDRLGSEVPYGAIGCARSSLADSSTVSGTVETPSRAYSGNGPFRSRYWY